MTPAEALATYLIAESVVTEGTVFANYSPPSPDGVLLLMEYAAGAPMETFGEAGTAVDVTRLQLTARGPKLDFDSPRALCVSARATLIAITNQVIETVTFVRVRALDVVLPNGPDPQERPMFVCNLEMSVNPA